MDQSKSKNSEQATQWKVRKAVKDDLEVLTKFSVLIAMETEGKKVDSSSVRSGIANVIHDPSKGVIFVACDEKKGIGCFMINGREWSEWRNGFFLWLTGTYTEIDYRRKGVRKVLFDHGCEWAKSDPDVVGLRGYRHKSNKKIHKAELRTGMQQTDYRINEIIF